MKIFIPIFGFGKAGGYRVLSNLASKWVQFGNEVYFICIPNYNSEFKPYYPTNGKILYFNLDGNLINDINNFNANSISISLFYRLKQILALIKAINFLISENDVLLANYSLTAFAVYFSNKKCKKYYYIQAYEPEYFDKSIKGQIFAFIISLTYRLKLIRIVNSPLYFNYKKLKSRYCVFPGIDFNLFNIENKTYKYNFDENELIIGCIGRIEKSKGTIDVIKAYDILKNMPIKCKLKIAVFGNEDILDDKSIIKAYPQNDIELSLFYKSVDILIAPGTLQIGSVHYPVIEAMSTGTPVITTGHYPSNSENSWIVPINSPEKIASQVLEIYKNPELAYKKSKKALEDVVHLSWESVSNEMFNIFRNSC